MAQDNSSGSRCLYCGAPVDESTLGEGVNKCPNCGRTLLRGGLKSEGSGETAGTQDHSASQGAASQDSQGITEDVPAGKKPIRKRLVRRRGKAPPRKISCTSCGAPIEIKNQAMAEMITCSYCGSVLDLNSPDRKVLRKILLDKRPPCPLKLGDKGTIKGIEWEVIGRIRVAEEVIYTWDEFLLFSPDHGYAWLELDEGHWTFLRKNKSKPQVNPRTLEPLDKFSMWGKKFTVVDKGMVVVQYIEGEFTYQTGVNDTTNYLEAVSPPLTLSAEWTDQELEWISGEYMEPERIQRAFKLDSVPERKGIARNQPYYMPAWRKQVMKVAGIFVLLFVIMSVVSCVSGSEVESFKVSADQYLESKNSEPYISPPIKFAGKTVSRIKFFAPLNDSWVWLDVVLLNEDKQPVMHFAEEISYYSGPDWSEGSKKERVVFKVDEPGTYYLSMVGEGGHGTSSNTPRGETIAVTVYKGCILARYFIIMAVVAGIFPIFESIRHGRYQGKRIGDLLNDDDDD